MSCSLQAILVLTNGARKSIRVGATTMKYHLLEESFAHQMHCLSPRLLRLMSFRRRHNVCRFYISTDSCGFGFTIPP